MLQVYTLDSSATFLTFPAPTAPVPPRAEWVWLGGTIDTVIWLGTGLTYMCLCFLSESHHFSRRTLHFNLEDSKHQLIIPRSQLVIHLSI